MSDRTGRVGRALEQAIEHRPGIEVMSLLGNRAVDSLSLAARPATRPAGGKLLLPRVSILGTVCRPSG